MKKKTLGIILIVIIMTLLSGCTTDRVHDYVSIIDEEHAEIHLGDMYTVTDTREVDTTTFKWQITTGAKESHIVFDLSCTGEATYIVTEDSDRTNGTALTEFSRFRSSDKVAATVVTYTPTGGSTDGTAFFTMRTGATGVGGKTIQGGGTRAQNEWILKANTKYVIAVTTYDTVYVTCKLDWYEEIAR